MEKDAQLIQASKLKSLGEMSAGMAHELNQPLNAIKMGSDFLAMVVEDGIDLSKEHLHQLVTEVSSQVDRAADIINAMRAFGRKADYSTEKININKPVRGVYSIAGKQFELDGITIRLELSEDIPPVLAHENRLQQVFLNLVANARDAIKEKGEKEGLTNGLITIRTYQEDGRVIAEVSDNGTGVRESVRNKIFEPFFTTKETTLDMGLGLAITYRIVKDYGGDIEVRSEEGEGATFLLGFPPAP
jgi:histidine kinase